MIYPEIGLSEIADRFFYAEYPEDPERGAFLEIEKSGTEIRVRVDRFSMIPFYQVVHEGRLYGGTTLRKLLAEIPSAFPRKLDRVAAVQFLRTNSMIGDATLLEGVKRVSPGSEIRFTVCDGKLEMRTWWRLPGEVDVSLTERKALDRLHETFHTALRSTTRGADRVGVHFSGGLDSRQILGGLLELRVPFTAFTYGIEKNLDVVIAGRFARKFGIDHVFRSWSGLEGFRKNLSLQMDRTDGMQALIHGHGIEMHAMERERVDRLLLGHFLDLFIQAHMYNPALEEEHVILEDRLYCLFDGGPCSALRADYMESSMLAPDLRGCFEQSIRSEIRKLDYMIPEKRYDALYFLHHGLRRLLPQYHSAARDLDCRLPALDRDFFDFAWSVPGPIRKDRRLQIRLLQTRYRETVDRIRVVMDNNRLRYIGRKPLRQLRFGMDYVFRHPRIRIQKPYQDYYGEGIRKMANRDLLPWMRERILNSPLTEYHVLNPDFIRYVLEGKEMRKDIGLGFYAALLTLSEFILWYIEGTRDTGDQT